MLSKPHRLAKTKDVRTALGRGRGFLNSLLTVKFLPAKAAVRFTVVVSTKVSKNATARNRLKRIIREFIRLRLGSFRPGDYVIIVKPKAARAEEKELLGQLELLVTNAKLLNKVSSTPENLY